MTMAAVGPAIHAAGAVASFASTIKSALFGLSDAGATSSAAALADGANLSQMERALKRQEATQLRAMEMQTEANIQKMMADTINSIASGHLDSGAKVQNASIKAAQGIHF